MSAIERTRPNKGDTERAAAELVLQDLRNRGLVTDLVGRPDLLDRTNKAVDFLLRVNGSDVGLEVTDFYPSERYARRRGVGTSFAGLLEAELLAVVCARGLGSVVVSLTLTHRPPALRALRSALAETLQAIIEQMPVAGYR